MSKLLRLNLLLAIMVFKPEAVLANTLKKESGICGKTMSTILKTDPENDPFLARSVMKNDKFCDSGRYEENANFIISFYNAKNKLIYDKHVFLNIHTFLEETNSKGKFVKTKIFPSKNSRIVKIPITKEMGEAHSYKIQSLVVGKKYEIKKIKW